MKAKTTLPLIAALLLAACGQSALDLGAGMCFNGGVADLENFAVVECAEPHDSEVYAVFDTPDADAYPGPEALVALAGDRCGAAFETFVGVPYGEADLTVGLAYPSETTWAAGDRVILCTVRATSGQLTGSAEGSGA